ncbi:uncharacterized protein LOC105648972 isoform X3 [Jatropha curcas]|uniref:uncharacterized protein LOC105648972 isoform X3 n=1 Tax=Jatropha curcas TaxID=180498 RepID=UPI0009D751EA|nr:uncharacterized protein LOC105648972 isoform X3 [Jatropha curcas]
MRKTTIWLEAQALINSKSRKRKRYEKNNNKVDTAKEAPKHINTVENIETESFEMKDNIVLRQLLKPRYFDPPSDCRVACSSCGEEGYVAVRCKLRNQKKPSFVCGSSEHIWRRCKQQRRILQLEKDQENQSNPDTCLRCWGSGHDMFSCRSDSSLDDLKEIQCYVCRKFGHLCCPDFPNLSPTELSCYNCGESGHLGSECKNLFEPNNGSKGSITCFKCGEQGHFAKGCINNIKVHWLAYNCLSLAGEELWFCWFSKLSCIESIPCLFYCRMMGKEQMTSEYHNRREILMGSYSAPHDLTWK